MQAHPVLVGQLQAGLALGQGVVPVARPQLPRGQGPVVEGKIPLRPQLLAEAPTSLQGGLALGQPVGVVQAGTQEQVDREAVGRQPGAQVGSADRFSGERQRADEVPTQVGDQG
jgi:hypothetical protein